MGTEKEEKVGPVYALYARVSHDDNIQDPQVQLEPMREYCRKKGSAWKEYIDLETGRTIEREGYMKAMAEIEEWDTFMVFLPDRLTREGPERGITEVTRILDEGRWKISSLIDAEMDPFICLPVDKSPEEFGIE